MENNEISRFQPMIEALEGGNLTPTQLSAVSQALHLGLLNSAIEAVKDNDAMLTTLKSMEQRALEFLEERFQEALPMMTYSSILEFLGEVSKIRNKATEVKLKIYNTRDLFNINPISEDDRALLGLLRLVGDGDRKNKLRSFIQSLTEDDNVIDVPATQE
jgi:hypothetical protein